MGDFSATAYSSIGTRHSEALATTLTVVTAPAWATAVRILFTKTDLTPINGYIQNTGDAGAALTATSANLILAGERAVVYFVPENVEAAAITRVLRVAGTEVGTAWYEFVP